MYGIDVKEATSTMLLQQKNIVIDWNKFCGMVGIPVINEGHPARTHHVSIRNAIVKCINDELVIRKLPVRLHVNRNVGVKVVNSDHVAPKEIEIRFRRCANAQKKAIDEWRRLCDARGLSDKDRLVLSAVAQSVEFGKNATAGAVMQLESIPDRLKLDLMKTLGDGKKIKPKQLLQLHQA